VIGPSPRAVLAVMLLSVAAAPATAQNAIGFAQWEGFATRDAEGAFERCVLYNRSIAALTVSPNNMLGITRDANGRIGLLVFYEPRALTRGTNVPLHLKIDDRPTTEVDSRVVSDFHLQTTTPLDPAIVGALRTAKSIETTAQAKTQKFDVSNLAGVRDELVTCVNRNAVK
jgi:hypothetical protein